MEVFFHVEGLKRKAANRKCILRIILDQNKLGKRLIHHSLGLPITRLPSLKIRVKIHEKKQYFFMV